ncbi:MAG TPA: hypothetical protein VEX64_04665, partial [Pyrinomonadaceae bacterium]|nr:hypothetical protein [Pyrinomonadaceae bacterium]
MNAVNVASLVNLLGFAVGIALYAMLLAMVLRRPRKNERFDFLLPATALLGLLWNAGELLTFIWRDFVGASVSPLLSAVAYSALGFLPAVVVHSAWISTERQTLKAWFFKFAAYALSFGAAVLHFQTAIFQNIAFSNLGLQILTFGYL